MREDRIDEPIQEETPIEGEHLTLDEQEHAEETSDLLAEQRIQEEKISQRKALLEAQYPGIILPDPDFYENVEQFDEDIGEIVAEAKRERNQRIADARITGDAIAQRLRETVPGPDTTKFSPADWEKMERSTYLMADVERFSEKLMEAETKGDIKGVKDYRGRLDYTIRAIRDLGTLDAVKQETKDLATEAEALMLQNPSNEVTWQAFHKNSDTPYVYLRREIAEKSPRLTGKRVAGTDPLIKVELPMGKTAKSVFEEVSHYSGMNLEDFLLSKGWAPLEVIPQDEPEPTPETDNGNLENMGYKAYVKARKEGKA